jgi:hypothetical protein
LEIAWIIGGPLAFYTQLKIFGLKILKAEQPNAGVTGMDEDESVSLKRSLRRFIGRCRSVVVVAVVVGVGGGGWILCMGNESVDARSL